MSGLLWEQMDPSATGGEGAHMGRDPAHKSLCALLLIFLCSLDSQSRVTNESEGKHSEIRNKGENGRGEKIFQLRPQLVRTNNDLPEVGTSWPCITLSPFFKRIGPDLKPRQI